MGNPITWFEIVGPDPKGEAWFYSDLFGWHTKRLPEWNYYLIDTQGRDEGHGSANGINGRIAQTRDDHLTGTVIYVENRDIQALLDKAETLGAKTVIPVQVTEVVTLAQFADPWGNRIGLVQGDGRAQVSEGDNPPVTWFELSYAEPQPSWDFYRELFGWSLKEGSGDGFLHASLGAQDQGIPGGIGSSPDGQTRTTIYAQVDDLRKYLERAESLGAKTVVEPISVEQNTSIAVFEDPQGTVFGLMVHKHFP